MNLQAFVQIVASILLLGNNVQQCFFTSHWQDGELRELLSFQLVHDVEHDSMEEKEQEGKLLWRWWEKSQSPFKQV